MATLAAGDRIRGLHPLHAILLAFPVSLFVGALLTDLAYRASFQPQWINFSSWLIVGALLTGGFATVWAIVELVRFGAARRGQSIVFAIALAVMWVLGLINALIHGKDAAASMPAGVYLSAVVAVLALLAAWVGYSGLPTGSEK